MVLLTSFYEIKKQSIKDDVFITKLVFNENHSVYSGHFPKNPITPGVCLIQTAKELLESFLKKSLRINKILTIKFLKLVIPNNTKELEYSIRLLNNTKEEKEIIALITISDTQKDIYTKARIIYTSI